MIFENKDNNSKQMNKNTQKQQFVTDQIKIIRQKLS